MHPNTAYADTLKKITLAVDAAALAESCFYDLLGLFDAIYTHTEEHTTAHTLASIGKYLTDNWGNLNENARTQLEAELAQLRLLKPTQGEPA